MRALLRAELLNRGFTVFAIDQWPVGAHPDTHPRVAPRVVIVDLHELDDPGGVLTELGQIFSPGRVLAVTALATLAADAVRQMGFHVVARPAQVGDIVGAAAEMLASEPDGPPLT